jgi:hypothetical protein
MAKNIIEMFLFINCNCKHIEKRNNFRKILVLKKIKEHSIYSNALLFRDNDRYFQGLGGMILIGSLPLPSPPLTQLNACRFNISFSDNLEINDSRFLAVFADLSALFIIQ